MHLLKRFIIILWSLVSLQLFGWKVSEEDSDLDEDLNRKRVQAFYDIFYVSLFVMAQCIIMAVKSFYVDKWNIF